jgi:predicted NBD/HSP70 family sugar kinase
MSIDTGGIPCECGNVGCLERYVSTMLLLKNVRAGIGSAPSELTRKATLDTVIAAYRKGDSLAAACVNKMAAYIGHALASLSNVLNPGLVILGDEMAAAGKPFLGEVKKAFNSRVSPTVRESTEISLSDIKENPYLLGGVQVVVEGCLAIPNFFVNIRQNSLPCGTKMKTVKDGKKEKYV